jgi:hypothetical protein
VASFLPHFNLVNAKVDDMPLITDPNSPVKSDGISTKHNLQPITFHWGDRTPLSSLVILAKVCLTAPHDKFSV